MSSFYLNGLTVDQYTALKQQLWQQQSHSCFICEDKVDLALDDTDIDHVIPTRDSGKDDPSNFALTHASCNRSKQASDLRIARVLARFDRIKEGADSDDRGANLNDVLKNYGGAKSDIRIKLETGLATYVALGVNGDTKMTVPIHEDSLSGMRYFFALLPIEVIHHDERINPRPIGANLRGLIEEFPQATAPTSRRSRVDRDIGSNSHSPRPRF